jgi:hypothetical protein
MSKGPRGQQRKKLIVCAPKSKKLPRKLPDDLVSRAAAIARAATNQEIGDTADKITRAPKKKVVAQLGVVGV